MIIHENGKPLFGPGGNSEEFYKAGKKSTKDAPAWVMATGLDAYEYEAGNGIAASEETLRSIGAAAKVAGVHMSFHTPYFISLSGVEIEKRLKSIVYIRDSLWAADLLGAKTIVVHTGSAAKITREEAMRLAADTLLRLMDSIGGTEIAIGLETMGKKNQLGTLEEVITLCKLDPHFVPVVDFGHLNARECGGVFNTADDYTRVFDAIGSTLGDAVARNLHCHFSKIEWTAAGEKKHLTFADEVYGPDFEPLATAIARDRLTPCIISESAGTQSEDARAMKNAWLQAAGL
ncbi:MAG: TIM barrel protein [Clostridia bacterium]|nr:TIM barrel protein [Clostridia bacterium]